MKVGDGFGDGVTTGPMIDENAIVKVKEHIADAVSKGAKIETGGKEHEKGGLFFQPTILTGVTPDMIYGMVTYAHDNNNEIDVCRSLGVDKLTHFILVHHSGGAACGVVHQAAMAVASGACNYCLVWRAFNERSEERFGAGVQERPPAPTPVEVDFGWSSPFGLLTPASWVAMFAQRYMHEYGATSEDFGRVAVACRKHAANNPAAFFYGKPITLEEHQASRWIVKPLRLLDCCQESDGGQALLITTLDLSLIHISEPTRPY